MPLDLPSVEVEAEVGIVVEDDVWSPVAFLRRRFRQVVSHASIQEVSGMWGDLGTFLPIYCMMVKMDLIYGGPALFSAGLCHVVTGILWDVPMPVQPMKSIAAVALIDVLNQQQVTTAGVWVGVFFLVLGVTGGIDFINRWVPHSVVSGLQIGIGLSLSIRGLEMISNLPWWGLDSVIVACMAAIVCIRAWRGRGLLLLDVAVLLAVTTLLTSSHNAFSIGWSYEPVMLWALSGLQQKDWSVGFWQGAFPQLPLSTLNSVISVCCLCNNLYPSKRKGPENTVLTRRQVALSVGLMNLLLCPLGAMPSCHGAGGLAGQHQFGARHGSSVVILGLLKMLLALLGGSYILPFFLALPVSIFASLLVASGLELAKTGLKVLGNEQDEDIARFSSAALVTSAIIVGLKTQYGAMAGCLVHYLYVKPQRNVSAQSTEEYNRLPYQDSDVDCAETAEVGGDIGDLLVDRGALEGARADDNDRYRISTNETAEY